MLIIDAHAHAYAENEIRYPSIDNPIRPPEGTGSIHNLERVMKENDVSRTCVIQPGTFYKWDNRFICDTSKVNPERMAGVCSLNPDDSRSPGLLKEFVSHYGIRGLRSYAAADGTIDHSGVRDLWKASRDAGIPVNVFVNSDKTDELAHLLEQFPNHSIVIDHCLNLKTGPEMAGTLSNLMRLAKFPNTLAKLSFLPTGSSEEYPFRDMHEPTHKIIAAFTPSRCIWGSNFPAQLWTPKATYAQHLRLFTHELRLDPKTVQAILGETARRLWFSTSLKRQAGCRT
jgi:predicted TIM-barrel fold metal-dependent hydrolase